MISTSQQSIANAEALMDAFARNSGLEEDGPGRRYLWTDAFAVCNFLALATGHGRARHLKLALRLIDRVHHVLGRHRDDDRRRGWISGLDERDGRAHPTRGGLRIGKRLPERGPAEAFDERLEWERDGQYFHYLTRWMRALDLAARITGQRHFHTWACELAAAAHGAFLHGSALPGRRRMYWKMSIDLARPLVESMGQHDPLDGYVTWTELEATSALLGNAATQPGLREAAADFAAMIDPDALATADPLGLGGLLIDAARLAQSASAAGSEPGVLFERMLSAARIGLSHYLRQSGLDGPASQRLAFRELGLAIGLAGVEFLAGQVDGSRLRLPARARGDLEALQSYVPLAARIESFWLDPANRRQPSWRDHQDINDVMLASALVPEGIVRIQPAGSNP